MKKKILILGAGMSGLTIAAGLGRKFGDCCDIILVGPDSKGLLPGLFYYNTEIPGICDKEIQVDYDVVRDLRESPDSEEMFKLYQLKSRGVYDDKVKTSSLSLVGKSVKGYLPSVDLTASPNVTRCYDTVTFIDFDSKKVVTDSKVLEYDFLVVTIPLKVLMQLALKDKSKSYDLEFKSKSIPIYQSVISDDPAAPFDKIMIYYDLHENSVFYRHSSFMFNGKVTKLVSESIRPFEGFQSTIYPGKILPSNELRAYVDSVTTRYTNVGIFGRYARWDYHYTVDQSYFDAMNFVEKCL